MANRDRKVVVQIGTRRKRQIKNGDETDACGSWRHRLRWYAGERANIKRGARRRERHEAKQELQDADQS